MATIVLQAAGTIIGTILGGPLGGLIGKAAGALAGSFLDQQLFSKKQTSKGPRLSDLHVMSSSEGAPIPRAYGRMRMAGQVIWATDLREVKKKKTKNHVKTITYKYYSNFAVAICEGQIDRIGRVWADGKEFNIKKVNARVYKGTETQMPDSLITSKMGAGNAPAYRGVAYVVFQNLEVTDFGNRIPQLSFEVIRTVSGTASEIRAVSIIPGSTEFGYDTRIVKSNATDGIFNVENAHASSEDSDWTVSIDQLTDSCRNLGSASLVVGWFGTDLRCGSCQIRPGVTIANKSNTPYQWVVGGSGRSSAYVVSTSGLGPAYGGTPSDLSVIRAIQDLNSRNIKVLFHPFILMDIPTGNGKPDPYGGTEQGAYPWRGRITCSIAPGRSGTPDKTAAVASEISAFVGSCSPSHFTNGTNTINYSGPAEWSFRRLILHYAKLCALAGGVDSFIIGSEMRGMSTLRRDGNVFPFVQALVTLAAEVKAILPSAKISYGADWTEYAGHRPADGSNDVFFHLDPLWSSSSVSFVGINNYMPLSDWRESENHLDRAAGFTSIYKLAYLQGNIAGGEGFDWYYASQADRDAQIRSPITDGAYGKPWVFRWKDLKSFWSNQHYNRPGGVESGSPTGWVPQSKPFWFTEHGCPAVDKGANAPNAFIDVKSSESLLPYYSTGTRDDLMQSRFITAVSRYWITTGAHNPVSSVYGAGMVDGTRIYYWAWDARPYPQFPALSDVWSDVANYATGHWLNGRIGSLPVGSLIESVCQSYGLYDVDTSEVEGLLQGFQIDRVMSARDALEGVMTVFGVDAAESGTILRFFMRAYAEAVAVTPDGLVDTDSDAALFTLRRGQEAELPTAVRLDYVEVALDYRVSVAESRRSYGNNVGEAVIELPAALIQTDAQRLADITLQQAWAERETAEMVLPPSLLAVEPGDVVNLTYPAGTASFRIEEIADAGTRKIKCRSFVAAVLNGAEAENRDEEATAADVFGPPAVTIIDIPLTGEGITDYAPWLAAVASPWPGELSVYRNIGGSSYELNLSVNSPSTVGVLTSPLAAGPEFIYDRGNSFTVTLAAGELTSVTVDQMLQGANMAVVGTMETGFEVIQFASATLIAPLTYTISFLLRGQAGSGPEIRSVRPVGDKFILLDDDVRQPNLTLAQSAQQQTWQVNASDFDLGVEATTVTFAGKRLGLRPPPPCYAKMARVGSDVRFTWIRRSRISADAWDVGDVPLAEESEAYQLDIMSGATVKRTVTVTSPAYLYTAAQIIADFGADPGVFTIRIAQISTTFGPGATLQRTLNG